MKKYITHILLFFLIVSLVDIVAGRFGDFLQSHANGGATMRTNSFVSKDIHDVIVMGSSRAHHHYDTPFICDSIGIDIYNAGYDGNGVVLAYGFLSMVLERYSPKLIIYDITPNFDIYEYQPDNHNARYLTILKPYYDNPEVGGIMKDISYEEWLKCHSGLIRYNSGLARSLMDKVGLQGVDDCGYAPASGALEDDRKENASLSNTIDPIKLRYVEQIISLSRQNDIPIVFVASPWYGATDSEILNPIKDICKKREVPFWDYFTDSEFCDRELFNDPGHLNNKGARLFSKKIIQHFAVKI